MPESTFRQLCVEKGLAVTHQRQVIWDILSTMHGHPSPEAVYERVREQIPSISLATVYKNIRTFIEHGLMSEVSLHHGPARLETNMHPHHHMVCVGCRNITDVPGDLLEPVRLRKGAPAEFEIHRYSVEIHGFCSDCARRMRNETGGARNRSPARLWRTTENLKQRGSQAMLGVGEKFPEFSVKATVSTEKGKEFETITSESYPGRWKVYFFWPKDFTFVCPTEIATFGKLNREFDDRDTQVVGGSTDSEFVHLAWRKDHPDLRELPFPMLADVKRELSEELGILDPNEGVCQRATFIVDPDGVIRFVSVTDLSVGRNVDDVLRVLDALQTDELCPCNWQKGQETLHV